jgi:glycosyltransferase involved in cell wall biosynthesis
VPLNARIIFFGASDHSEARKGMAYAVDALNKLAEMPQATDAPLFALIAGESDKSYASRLRMPCLEMGSIHDDRLLAMAYQAAEVFLCPSIEDAGPQMIPESLMSGTPVVAFESCGGVPDFLRKNVNGYPAKHGDFQDLANGLDQVLRKVASGEMNAESCRATVLNECTMGIQGTRYKRLYLELLQKSEIN